MNINPSASHDIAQKTFSVIFIGLLIAANFWILKPFLTSLIWAGMLVIATWPILTGIQAKLWNKRGLAVSAMTLSLLLAIAVPVVIALLTIAGNVGEISSKVSSLSSYSMPDIPPWLSNLPLIGPRLAEKWQKIAALSPEELAAYTEPYAQGLAAWFIAKAGTIGTVIFQFFLTMVISAVFFYEGELIAAGIMKFAVRLAGRQGENATLLACRAIRGVALGIVVTAIIQTALGGIGLIAAGVPVAPLLIALMLVLSLAQIGPLPVLLPAVIWTFWSSGILIGTVLAVLSVAAVSVDYVIRPVLIKKGADLPVVIIFAGVIGGLIAFGIMGLFIGPVVFAVTYTLLSAWVSGEFKEKHGEAA